MRHLFLGLLLVSGGLTAAGEEPRRHVVLIVWDGMRPDFANEKYAPTLRQLAKSGVRFTQHHSVYLTATDVNGAAMATGSWPNRSGLFANLEYLPRIDPLHPVDCGTIGTIRRGDEVTGGNYLLVPTFVERLRQSSRTVALAGSKSVAVLFDRKNSWTVAEVTERPVAAFAAAPMEEIRREEMEKLLGPILVSPQATASARNRYATRALTEILWREDIPDFSLLWLSQPDWSEHNFAPGSPEAVAAIGESDENLRLLLDALEKKKVRATTDVLVVSDHGFSTIRRSFDLVADLSAAGFHAGKEFSAAPHRGDVLVCGNGGSVIFYLWQRDETTLKRLIEFFAKTDYVDTLFTRDGRPGTKALREAAIDVEDPPDLVLAFKGSNEKNKFGVAGMVDADWNRPAGQGTHATLNETDCHNLLIGAGPDFRSNFEDEAASSNIDLAPTIMHLLGAPGDKFQGRILQEALAREH